MTDSPIWGMVICTVVARVAIRTSTVALARPAGGYGGEHASEPAQVLGLGVRGPAAGARQVAARRRSARAHLGFAPGRAGAPRASSTRWSCRRPGWSRPPRSPSICRSDDYERAAHAYGKSYRDVVRAFRGRFDHLPDVVAHPGDEAELESVLDWCESAGAAAIPFGGGTSVVGGVEAAVGDGYAGVVTIDLKRLDRVLEVDPVSQAARIQAGATGPRLEEQLREHGLTLRHYPQSFEYSTLGGWIATRAGGHFATLGTHIDDLVESVRALTPRGRLGEPAAARLRRRAEPGPDADRLRGHPRRDHRGLDARARAAALQGLGRRRPSTRSRAGAEAVRALAQSGLYPSNCRLLDPGEARSDRRGARGPRAAGARLRVGRPPARRVDGARCRALPRPRRRAPGRAARRRP